MEIECEISPAGFENTAGPNKLPKTMPDFLDKKVISEEGKLIYVFRANLLFIKIVITIISETPDVQELTHIY